MTATDAEGPAPRRGRFGPAPLLALALLLGLGWVALALASGRPLVAPEWLTRQVEARAAEALGGPGRVELGGIYAVLSERHVPRLVLRDLTLRNAVGAEIARIPELRARLSPEALLGGRLALTRLTLVGADLTLRRDRLGRFDFALGAEQRALPRAASLPEVLASIDRAFGVPVLSELDTISGEALRLTFQDASTDRVWRAESGGMTLTQSEGRRTLSLGFALAGGAGKAPAPVRLTFAVGAGGASVDMAAEVSNITAADLAGQVPALAFLTATDAPLSANLRARLDGAGALRSFDGALEVGAGAVRPAGAARPIPFDGAKAYLTFDPVAGRIGFTEVSVTTPEARFRASGQAFLRDVDSGSGLPGQMLVQLALSDVEMNPAGQLAEPARFGRGAADLRLTFSPLSVELGQLTLVDQDRRFRTWGRAVARENGWEVALDVALNAIPHDRLFALWPLTAVPKTREWLVDNVTEGLLTDVKAALRLYPGSAPRLALGYEFNDGKVRFLPTLPPIVGAAGHAVIDGSRYTMDVREGRVVSPDGEPIDTAGSVFVVPDIRVVPAPAEIRLETDSSITAALTILDEPPFEFLKKAGRATDLAQGRARVSSLIRLPLAGKVPASDIFFDVEGVLTRVRSDTLVPGRMLTSPELRLKAGQDGIAISGPGRVGAARFDAGWSQSFGPSAASGSRIEGSLVLDQAFLDEFGIALPPGSVSGEGAGQIEIDLPRAAPPRFRVSSTLAGLGLSVPALDWSLGRNGTGTLEVAGTLGQPAVIDRLALKAPGLDAEGSVRLNPDGSLGVLGFSRLRAGGWLDAPVSLTGRGPGRAPAVAVTGGTIDLRETSLAGSGAGGGGPITLALDRMIVTEGISFSDFRADLSTQGGLNGRFSGRLAGEAPVVGALSPTREGTAVRLQSEDAGAVLRSSGLLDSARQGVLDLTLVPLPGEGRYDGRLAISNLRLRGAPVLADLLSAISVVGLLEQLDGQGILFSDVTGEFTLEPRGITLRRGSAVGSSLGVSMAGVYDLRSKILDMQGTISPIYLLNSIGQVFTRRGEGLFGFNYRMSGPASDPQMQVNPLSILTPGMFREIFRAPAPRLQE